MGLGTVFSQTFDEPKGMLRSVSWGPYVDLGLCGSKSVMPFEMPKGTLCQLLQKYV